MKRIITTIVCMLASLVVLKGAAAQQHAVRVAIPFDFVASGTHLPAGTYTIASRNGFTSIARDGGEKLMAVSAISVTDYQMDQNKLVFSTYDGEHFLSRVLCSAADMNLEFLPPKPKIGARVQIASNSGN